MNKSKYSIGEMVIYDMTEVRINNIFYSDSSGTHVYEVDRDYGMFLIYEDEINIK